MYYLKLLLQQSTKILLQETCTHREHKLSKFDKVIVQIQVYLSRRKMYNTSHFQGLFRTKAFFLRTFQFRLNPIKTSTIITKHTVDVHLTCLINITYLLTRYKQESVKVYLSGYAAWCHHPCPSPSWYVETDHQATGRSCLQSPSPHPVNGQSHAGRCKMFTNAMRPSTPTRFKAQALTRW